MDVLARVHYDLGNALVAMSAVGLLTGFLSGDWKLALMLALVANTVYLFLAYMNTSYFLQEFAYAHDIDFSYIDYIDTEGETQFIEVRIEDFDDALEDIIDDGGTVIRVESGYDSVVWDDTTEHGRVLLEKLNNIKTVEAE